MDAYHLFYFVCFIHNNTHTNSNTNYSGRDMGRIEKVKVKEDATASVIVATLGVGHICSRLKKPAKLAKVEASPGLKNDIIKQKVVKSMCDKVRGKKVKQVASFQCIPHFDGKGCSPSPCHPLLC